jgi:hypothetical protein
MLIKVASTLRPKSNNLCIIIISKLQTSVLNKWWICFKQGLLK